VVLAHAVLGCCWHHVHACGEAHDHLALAGWEHHWAGDDHPSAGCADCSHRGHGRDDCRGVKCSFVVGAKEKPGARLAVSSFSSAPTAPAADGLAGDARREEHLFFGAGSGLLPVRLHLLHQVLLI
jgi:hypothetical protein